jgi:carbon-monoxide dehydrogenase medium subunit
LYLPDFELHDAASLDEASELLGRYAGDARLLAGGTDLLVDLRTRRYRAAHVISLNRLGELRGVRGNGGGLRIGALTTIGRLVRSGALRGHYEAILDAATRMASQQIRNLATVGGNIACAAPCADLPPILIVMDASIDLRSASGERTVPLDAFFTGPRETTIAPGEVLTAVRVPAQKAGFGAAYARFGQRAGNAISVAAVAASLWLDKGGTIREGRIALGAVAPIPLVVSRAAERMRGAEPSAETFSELSALAMEAAQPICDVRGSADFRRELVGVLTRRALGRALERAKGGTS